MKTQKNSIKKASNSNTIETNLQHTQKLETLGILASGIAHDFNNLLVTILGNADLALLKLSSDSPLYHSIENIKKASLRASGLTNQILAYSGKGSFIVEPIDLNMFVDEMAHLLKVSISKNVTIKFSFTENLPTIEADAAQIRQVVMNLITNASEAIGENTGSITIKTGVTNTEKEQVSDKDLDSGKYVYIEIADTGCGMDEKTKAQIFDPFYTTKLTGRGLGLSIVHENVRGHKGSINVTSEPDGGTVFTVYLPFSGKPLKVAEEEMMPTNDMLIRGGSILVIDDEKDVLEVIKTMLETINFTVYTVSSGREGVEFFHNNADKIDIILIDITMPNMNGEEVLNEIRKKSADIPVILSSGYSEHDVKQQITERYLTDFIQKPYQIKTLIGKINTVLRNKL
ncbi:MAG TPA: ATP-binding protein [Anaerolineae bacterium]|nr:ATP-binding protein [Anaerolineae bacterium]